MPGQLSQLVRSANQLSEARRLCNAWRSSAQAGTATETLGLHSVGQSARDHFGHVATLERGEAVSAD